MTQIIVNFGGFDWSRTYVGPANEIVADADNHDLVLQDGATPGGFRFLNRNNADTRYQAKSPELVGLSNLPDDTKGILFRLGTAAYRIGSLEVNAANLELTSPDGFDGNPTFSFAATITSAHTWEGVQTFENEIVCNGGIKGPLEGDSTGTHIGDSEGVHRGNVEGDLTGNSMGSHVGGVDVRGADLQLDAGQIPASAIFGLLSALETLAIPNRIPHLWWGTIEEIPTGWLLCDGSNGTPDMRDRFVYGASETRALGTVAGSANHTHGFTITANGAHAHPVTVEDTVLDLTQIPSHRHLNGVTDDSTTQNPFNRGFSAAAPAGARGMDDVSSPGIYEGRTESVGGGLGHSHGASSTDAGNHTHAGEIASASHLPPNIALYYIIRL